MNLNELFSITSGITPAKRLARAAYETYYLPNRPGLMPDRTNDDEHGDERDGKRDDKPDDELHPFLSAVDFALPSESKQAIQLFIERIEPLEESDYGDFMREVNLYLLDLSESIMMGDATSRRLLLPIVENMQTYTQFRPTWHIESTKARLLNDARRLNELASLASNYYTQSDQT